MLSPNVMSFFSSGYVMFADTVRRCANRGCGHAYGEQVWSCARIE